MGSGVYCNVSIEWILSKDKKNISIEITWNSCKKHANLTMSNQKINFDFVITGPSAIYVDSGQKKRFGSVHANFDPHGLCNNLFLTLQGYGGIGGPLPIGYVGEIACFTD